MVLRPAKVFRGFPWSQSECWVGTQIPRCTACFSCRTPNINFSKFRHNIALPKSDYISPTTAAPTSLKSKLNKSRIQASPLPGGLAGTVWEPSKLPNYVSITPPSKTVVSLTTPPQFSSSLSLSLSQRIRSSTEEEEELWVAVSLYNIIYIYIYFCCSYIYIYIYIYISKQNIPY
jgi:hypothetical protein